MLRSGLTLPLLSKNAHKLPYVAFTLLYRNAKKQRPWRSSTHLKITSETPMFFCVQIRTQIENGAVLS
jgi:hypothetical protein